MDLEDASVGEMSEKPKPARPQEKPPVKRPAEPQERNLSRKKPHLLPKKPPRRSSRGRCATEAPKRTTGDVERGAKVKPPDEPEGPETTEPAGVTAPSENPRSPPNLEPPVEPERKSPPRAIPQRAASGETVTEPSATSRSPLSKK